MANAEQLDRIEAKIGELQAQIATLTVHRAHDPQLPTHIPQESAHSQTADKPKPLTVPRLQYNVPGGVMISLNVSTQKQSALLLKQALQARGISCWTW